MQVEKKHRGRVSHRHLLPRTPSTQIRVKPRPHARRPYCPSIHTTQGVFLATRNSASSRNAFRLDPDFHDPNGQCQAASTYLRHTSNEVVTYFVGTKSTVVTYKCG